MKNLATYMFIGLLILSAATVSAQQMRSGKPYLFNNFPDTINCTAKQLSNFFTVAQGQNIKVSFGNNLTLNGTVKTIFTKHNTLQTVMVKLPSFNNILFAVTKRCDEKNNIVYTAHLFDSAYADGYELKKTGNNNYQFTKILLERILPTCSQ